MSMEKLKLPKTELGKTGFKLSKLGLGGFHQVEISSEIVEKVIDTYLSVGGNYIETARGYGNGASEKKIGRALEGRRDEVVLCSKSGADTADGIRKDLELTLENLKTDHVEFYYFHGLPDEEKMTRIMAPGGALEGLLKAKEEGLISGIGLSSHNLPMYIKGMEALPIDLILIWSNYLEDQYLPEIRNEIFPYAKSHGIGITAMKPLGDGFLYRSPRNAIRYALGSGSDLLVCGMNSPGHVTEVAATICEGPATHEEREDILKNAVELNNYVCRQCGKCSADLMELFRLEGYADRQMLDYLEHDPADYALRLRLSGWFGLAGTARDIFQTKNWSEKSLNDGAPGGDCPYGIDIPRKISICLAKLTDADVNCV